jgi:hypothetical protein
MLTEPSKEAALRRAAAKHISSETVWPFDATVFLGDLNYRLDLPRLEVSLFVFSEIICGKFTINSFKF